MNEIKCKVEIIPGDFGAPVWKGNISGNIYKSKTYMPDNSISFHHLCLVTEELVTINRGEWFIIKDGPYAGELRQITMDFSIPRQNKVIAATVQDIDPPTLPQTIDSDLPTLPQILINNFIESQGKANMVILESIEFNKGEDGRSVRLPVYNEIGEVILRYMQPKETITSNGIIEKPGDYFQAKKFALEQCNLTGNFNYQSFSAGVKWAEKKFQDIKTEDEFSEFCQWLYNTVMPGFSQAQMIQLSDYIFEKSCIIHETGN